MVWMALADTPWDARARAKDPPGRITPLAVSLPFTSSLKLGVCVASTSAVALGASGFASAGGAAETPNKDGSSGPASTDDAKATAARAKPKPTKPVAAKSDARRNWPRALSNPPDPSKSLPRSCDGTRNRQPDRRYI
jgi:hypothetical protein